MRIFDVENGHDPLRLRLVLAEKTTVHNILVLQKHETDAGLLRLVP